MKLHKKTLLAIALATGPIHLAGCATMMEDNPELACALMGVAGGVVGYAIGDDTGAAVAGAAIGALGCTLIQHLGAENAKAVEDWQQNKLSSAPTDQPFTFTDELTASDGSVIKVSLNAQKPMPLIQQEEGDELVGKADWLTDESLCRPVKLGVSLDAEYQQDQLQCYKPDEDKFVLVKGAPLAPLTVLNEA